jgi:ComF family protein
MALRAREAGVGAVPGEVVPVPLHRRRMAARGFNQAELLARVVAEALSLPLRTDRLRRIRETRAQASLPGRLRREGPLGAFRAEGDLSGARVLLVDDVLTTGTTASECARVLREAGAERVYVIVFAR